MTKRQTGANRQAYITLHISVLLFGFAAIFGDLIHLPAIAVVWWRLVLSCLVLGFIVRNASKAITFPTKYRRMHIIGALVALHWICFFGSVKLANASIALITFATTAFFTAIIEPVVAKRSVRRFEIILGLLVIPGMTLIVQSVPPSSWLGIAVGLIGAFLAALFVTLNKKLVHDHSEMFITFVELLAGLVMITVFLPFLFVGPMSIDDWIPTKNDWLYLFGLAILCTVIGYSLYLSALKYLSAFVANLSINMEPVYGIVMAAVILNEHQELNASFYLGVIIILLAIFAYPLFDKMVYKRKQK